MKKVEQHKITELLQNPKEKTSKPQQVQNRKNKKENSKKKKQENNKKMYEDTKNKNGLIKPRNRKKNMNRSRI